MQSRSHVFDTAIEKLQSCFAKEYDSRFFDLYIPSMGGEEALVKEPETFDLAGRIVQDVYNSPHRSFLILGDSGLGKTTIGLWLTKHFWNMSERLYLPLYIHLPHLVKHNADRTANHEQLLNSLLQSYFIGAFLDVEEQYVIQKEKLLLILDGYDEINLPQQQNLYKSNRLDSNRNIKFITCCRPEALLFSDSDALFETSGVLPSGKKQYQTYYLQLFNKRKIKLYLKKFIQHPPEAIQSSLEERWATDPDIYWEWLKKIPNLMDLAQTPFLLSLIAQALPRMVKNNKSKNQENAILHYTRNDVFETFVKQWFFYQAKRIQCQGLLTQVTAAVVEKYLYAYAKNLAASLLNKEGTLSLELLDKDQTLNPALVEPGHDRELMKHYESIGRVLFQKGTTTGDENLKALRSGCLLRTREVKFQFLHKSLIEYLAAHHLFTGLQGEFNAWLNIAGDKVMLFNRQGLAEPQIINSLAEHAKKNSDFSGLLFDIVLETKEVSGLSCAASNAITILNRAGFDFSHQDFKNIQIPGADLTGAYCQYTDFSGANLGELTIENAFLQGAIFKGANLFGIKTGDYSIAIPDAVNSLAFYRSQFGPLKILIASENGYLYQFDVFTGAKEAVYPHFRETEDDNKNAKSVLSVDVHQKKHLCITSGKDKKINLWDLVTGKLLNTLAGHEKSVFNACFRADGDCIASASQDGTVRVWETDTGKLLHTIITGAPVRAIAYNPSGDRLVTSSLDYHIGLFNANTGELYHKVKVTEWIYEFQFFAGGTRLFAAGQTGLYSWNIQQEKLNELSVKCQSQKMSETYFDVSPDGKQLVIASRNELTLHDISTNQLIKTFEGHTASVTSVKFSPNNEFLVSGSKDKTVKFWKRKKSELPIKSDHSCQYQTSVAFSPDGSLLAFCRDMFVEIWDVKKWKLYKKIECLNPIGGVVFFSEFCLAAFRSTPDKGSYIIDIKKNTTRIISEEEKQAIIDFKLVGKFINEDLINTRLKLYLSTVVFQLLEKEINAHKLSIGQIMITGSRYNLRSSLNKKFIAFVIYNDKNILRLFDLIKEKEYSLLGHEDTIVSIQFTHDENYLISGCGNTIRVWNTSDGKCVKTFSVGYEFDSFTLSIDNLLAISSSDNLTCWRLDVCSEKSFSFLWSKFPCKKLILKEADITQSIGLSEINQQIFNQGGASGEIAPLSNYQPWCTLFQPIPGTASITLHPLVKCLHQNLALNENQWVISVAHKTSDATFHEIKALAGVDPDNTQHTFFIIEGVINHRRFIIRAELTTPGNGKALIEIRPINDIEKFKQLSSCYKAQQWGISADSGRKFLENIYEDQQKLIKYFFAGNKYHRKEKISEEYESCVSWCKKHLEGLKDSASLEIKFSMRWYDYIILTADLLTQAERSWSWIDVIALLGIGSVLAVGAYQFTKK